MHVCRLNLSDTSKACKGANPGSLLSDPCTGTGSTSKGWIQDHNEVNPQGLGLHLTGVPIIIN